MKKSTALKNNSNIPGRYLKNHPVGKQAIFVLGLLALALVAMLLLRQGKDRAEPLEVRFSIYPGHEDSAICFAVYYDSPEPDLESLKAIALAAREHDVPLTFFFTPRATETEGKVDEEQALDFDLEAVIDLLESTGIEYEIASSAYISADFASLSYSEQERLLKQGKAAFREHGIFPKGFIPPGFSYSYDSLLAAENSRYSYVVLPSGQFTEPVHPESVGGGKMSLIIFPYSSAVYDKGFSLVILDPDEIPEGNGSLSLSAFIESAARGKIPLLLREMDYYVRKAETVGATLTTDIQEGMSYITLSGLSNSTKIEFFTKLRPQYVNNTSGNKLLRYYAYQDGGSYEGFYVILNETSPNLAIKWILED